MDFKEYHGKVFPNRVGMVFVAFHVANSYIMIITELFRQAFSSQRQRKRFDCSWKIYSLIERLRKIDQGSKALLVLIYLIFCYLL
jgi:hypothetical protein